MWNSLDNYGERLSNNNTVMFNHFTYNQSGLVETEVVGRNNNAHCFYGYLSDCGLEVGFYNCLRLAALMYFVVVFTTIKNHLTVLL